LLCAAQESCFADPSMGTDRPASQPSKLGRSFVGINAVRPISRSPAKPIAVRLVSAHLASVNSPLRWPRIWRSPVAGLRPCRIDAHVKAAMRFCLTRCSSARKTPVAGRHLEDAGLAAIGIQHGADTHALQQRAPRNVLSKLFDRHASLDTADIGCHSTSLLKGLSRDGPAESPSLDLLAVTGPTHLSASRGARTGRCGGASRLDVCRCGQGSG
jgi:hypothetical protein